MISEKTRIAVGLPGAIDAEIVQSFVDEGADEFFIGYVPPSWWRRYGVEASPNRRHRATANILSRDALEHFAAAAFTAGVPFDITLNSHHLSAPDRPLIEEILMTAEAVGARGVILSDLAMGPFVSSRYPRLLLTASGEVGIYNREALRIAARMGFSRVVVPRELTFNDISILAQEARLLGVELEVFVLGEWCVYNGAACFTSHGFGTSFDFCSAHVARALVSYDGRETRLDAGPPRFRGEKRSPPMGPLGRHGWGGCRICLIPTLVELGVKTFKVPGRQSDASGAVALVRRVIRAAPATNEEVKRLVADPVFCSGTNCR